MIGDVCGKGPEAAALTALARYTVRTASSPDTTPSEILRTLHDSDPLERADLRFCTAALARIQSPSNGRGPARFTVALGGHPLPLVLRKSGKVEAIGEPGTLLGALPPPRSRTVDGRLSVGDSLDPLHRRGARRPRPQPEHDPDWFAEQVANCAGGAPTRSPRGWPRRRSSATAASPGRHRHSRPSSLWRRLAAVRRFTSGAPAGSIPTGASSSTPRRFRSVPGSATTPSTSTRSRSTTPSTGCPSPRRSRAGSRTVRLVSSSRSR